MASRPLPSPRLPLWQLALLVIALGLSSAFLLNRTSLRSADSSAKSPAPASLYSKTEPARNPERLTVVADAHKVVGWISGTRDHAGAQVSVRTRAGTDKVKIKAGNVFVWNYKVANATRVEFSLKDLKQTIIVQPPEKALSSSIFFLADRHVYRPGQTLHFAGFLRQLTEQAEFIPLAKKTVEVALKTERKGTVVQRWKLTSDDMGRITADYRFVDADPLDNYELSIPDCQGELKVNLAEYRKSKVQLRITSEQKGGEVKLRFAVVDFMDRPVPAKKVTFTAQVGRNNLVTPSKELKGEDFVHASHLSALAYRMEDLSEEEQLLIRGDPLFDATAISGPLAAPTAVSNGEVKLDGKSTGDFTLNVPKACQQPGNVVFVDALLLDGSGREERRTQTLPLTFLSEQLKLTLARTIYDVDEPIEVKMTTPDGKKVEAPATLVVMRLAQVPMPAWGWGNWQFGGQFGIMGFQGQFGQLAQLGFHGGFGGAFGMPRGNFGFMGVGNRGRNPGGWQTFDAPESVKRSLVTATVFKGDIATMKLSEAGAYKLVAIVERPEGGKWQQEIGCVVQGHSERSGVSLQLERSTFKSGEPLTGTLHSRFADAHVLLTVRDSKGLRVFKSLTTDKHGLATIKETLPADIRFGCVITAQYADSPELGDLHIATQMFHIEPADRFLQIETKTKPVYSPGEKVVLDIQVNRQEPVDLVVSVYDQALKTIKPMQAADIRSYYLADERAFDDQARDVLQRCLAGVTIEALLAKARKVQEGMASPPEEAAPTLYANLLANAKDRHFSLMDVLTLLELAGIKARMGTTTDPQDWPRWPRGGRKATLLDLLESRVENSRLHVGLLHDTFFLSQHDVSQPLVKGTYNLQRMGFAGPAFFGFGGGLGQLGAVGQLGGLGQLGMSVLPPRGQPVPLLGADQDQKDLFVRRDFSDSAYWNAKVRTDNQGKARVEFQVPDSLTAWHVVVTGVTKNMHVGQGSTSFQVDKPIMIVPILPRIFTEGDKTIVVGQVVNQSKAKQTLRVRLKVHNGTVVDRAEREITLAAGAMQFVSWTFQPGSAGFTQLLMSVEGSGSSDASLKRLPVARAAVEETVTKSGFCKDPAIIEIPKGVDPATAQLEIRLAPTLMADLVDTLDYLVDYPYGCAEQTMSRFLPAIKVAQVLKHFEIDNPVLRQKLPGCVEGGIKRLLELQQADGGWGWNGNGAVHEMMTPYVLYGLLQAEEAGYHLGAEKAIANGLNRLEQFIRQLRDQVLLNKTFLTDRIFCMYVFGQRHPIEADWWKQISQEADEGQLADQALALALQMAVQHKNDKLAVQLAEQLRKRAVQEQGLVFWRTGGFSRWQDDPLEITATALKALVMYDASDALIPGILSYFNATKRGNRWNSTKDTAMIVEALSAFLAKQKLNPAEKPRLVLKVNDGQSREIVFDSKALVHKWLVTGNELRQGENKITFPEGTQGVMYRLILRHTIQGKDIPAKDQGLNVTREYWLVDTNGKRLRQLQNNDTIARGSYLECIVRASQKGVNEMRYVLLENPRPSCCEFIPENDRRFPQTGTPYVLREERETHLACHYEQVPAQIENRCVLLAEIAGEFVVPPAQVERMYQTEIRGHSGTFRFKVVDQ